VAAARAAVPGRLHAPPPTSRPAAGTGCRLRNPPAHSFNVCCHTPSPTRSVPRSDGARLRTTLLVDTYTSAGIRPSIEGGLRPALGAVSDRLRRTFPYGPGAPRAAPTRSARRRPRNLVLVPGDLRFYLHRRPFRDPVAPRVRVAPRSSTGSRRADRRMVYAGRRFDGPAGPAKRSEHKSTQSAARPRCSGHRENRDGTRKWWCPWQPSRTALTVCLQVPLLRGGERVGETSQPTSAGGPGCGLPRTLPSVGSSCRRRAGPADRPLEGSS